MGKRKNSPERLLEEIVKLDAAEFLGVCKILGVDIFKKLDVSSITDVEKDEESGQAVGHFNVEVEPRSFEDIWNDVCDTVEKMNRTRRRNLGKLVYAATSKEKGE